jgi:AraC family transcriptional regulator
VPPDQELHLRSEGGPDRLSILCEINRPAVDRWLPANMQWTEPRLAAALDVLQPDVRICMNRLSKELQRPESSSLELAKHLVAGLAIELARYCEALDEGPITGGLASWRLRAIDERLTKPGPPPSLDELAELCSVSTRQLTRGFRSSRGCTIGQHIESTRIELAKRLLGPADRIKEVSFQLGFASPAIFSVAFRRATGMTPRHFRARQRQKDR